MSEIVHAVHGPIGEFAYGEPWLGKDFELSSLEYATDLRAVELGYGMVGLSWENPGGSYTRLALVRSSYGIPVHYEDGDLVAEWDPEENPHNSHTDVLKNQPNILYYSLFALTDDAHPHWILTAGLEVVVVGDLDSLGDLKTFLPEEFLDADYLYAEDGRGPLHRFLEIFAYEMDITRSIISTALYGSNNYRSLPGSKLENMAYTYGVSNVELLGQTRMRSLISKIMEIRKSSGTHKAIETLVKAFTGWPSTVYSGANLLLVHDNGSFTGSSGTWVAVSGADISQEKELTPGGRASPGYLEVSINSSTFEISSAADTNAIHQGVPVVGGHYYAASVYTYSSVPTDVVVHIDWYDSEGVFIERKSGLPESAGTDWHSRSWVVGAAPSNARRAIISVTGDNTSSTLYIDDVMFHKALQLDESALIDYEPPRKIWIHITPERVNYHLDPTFQISSVPTIDGPANASIQTDGGKFGDKYLRLVGSGEGKVTITLFEDDFIEGKWLTASGYGKGDSSARLVVKWTNYLGEEQQVRGLGTEPFTGWFRHSVSALAPSGTTKVKVLLEVDTEANEVYDFSAVLIERDSVVRPWFYGESGGGSGGYWQEYAWVDTPHDSPSMFWMHKSIRWPLLAEIVKEQIPLGFDYEIVFGMEPEDEFLTSEATCWWSASAHAGGTKVPNLGSAGNNYDADSLVNHTPTVIPYNGTKYVWLPAGAGNSITANVGGFVTINYLDGSASQLTQNPVNFSTPSSIVSITVRSGSHSGTVIGQFLASSLQGDSLEDTYGNTWTINRALSGNYTTLVDRSIWQLDDGGYFYAPNGSATNFSGSDSFTISMAVKLLGPDAYLLSKRGDTRFDQGYEMFLKRTDLDVLTAKLNDSTREVEATATNIPYGEWITITLVRDRDSRYATLWVNYETSKLGGRYHATIGGAPTAIRPIAGTADVKGKEPGPEDSPISTPWYFGTYDLTGNLTNPLQLIIGSEDKPTGYELTDVVIIPRALTAGEISQLSAELLIQ